VAHVQYAGHVGWRYHDGEWLPFVGYGSEILAALPMGVPPRLDVGGVIAGGNLHTAGALFFYEGAKVRASLPKKKTGTLVNAPVLN